MSANVGEPGSDQDKIAIGKILVDMGQDIKNLLTDNPEASKDAGYLKVFAEVVSAVGLLFKNDDVGNKLKQLLDPLVSYTSLMPYFLIIKSILDNVQRVTEVDLKEHKVQLELGNKELTRIAVGVTVIAQKLEDLGKTIIDIIDCEESKKAAKIKIFDFNYDLVSIELESCISDMGLIKRKIDEGLHSIRGILYTPPLHRNFYIKIL